MADAQEHVIQHEYKATINGHVKSYRHWRTATDPSVTNLVRSIILRTAQSPHVLWPLGHLKGNSSRALNNTHAGYQLQQMHMNLLYFSIGTPTCFGPNGRCVCWSVCKSRITHRSAYTTPDRACIFNILTLYIFNHERHSPHYTYVNKDCTLNGQIYNWYSVTVTS